MSAQPDMTVHIDEYEACECRWCTHGALTGRYVDIDDLTDNLQRLSDWHDEAHGLTLWAACPHMPCKILTDEFRSTP